MVLSLIYYYVPKYGGVYWFRGPVANIEWPVEYPENGGSEEEMKDPPFVETEA